MLASLCWALCVLSPAPMVSRAASRAGGVRMGEDDLSSAFAGRMRELADSEKREKEQQVKKRGEALKADAADFLAGGKKEVSAGRAYNAEDDLAEVKWYDSSDLTFIGGATALLIALFIGNTVLTQWDEADRQLRGAGL